MRSPGGRTLLQPAIECSKADLMHETSAPPASLRLTVKPDALGANWRALDAMSGAARAGAAVKADCYGLGADTCVPILRDAGCDQFFVAHWSEVAAVLRHVSPDRRKTAATSQLRRAWSR